MIYQGVTGGIRTLAIQFTAECATATPQPQAAREGFEPSSSDSKSDVLPLDDLARYPQTQ